MDHFKKRFIITFCTLITLVWASSASALSYNKMVLFGDSLSDHNGLYTYMYPILGEFDPVSNPNGVRKVWSNGDVWAEYLATNWKSALENKSIAGAMSKGHENLSIQALIDAGQLPALGMEGQVNNYLAAATLPLSATDLYIIWIGGNDILQFSRGESSATTPEELINNASVRVGTAYGKLYAAGARTFMFLTLPDLGKTPGNIAQGEEAQKAATQLTGYFNLGLLTAVTQFTTAYPDATMHVFDVFAFLNTTIAAGTFPNSTETYLVLDANGNDTGDVNEPADDYLFWDTIHPMTKAHSMLADAVEAQLNGNTGGGENPPVTGGSSSSNCFINSVGFAASPASLAAIMILIGVGGMAVRRRRN